MMVPSPAHQTVSKKPLPSQTPDVVAGINIEAGAGAGPLRPGDKEDLGGTEGAYDKAAREKGKSGAGGAAGGGGDTVGPEIATFKTHPAAGKGTKFYDKNEAGDIKGALRKSAPSLPKGFITSVYHSHTARQVRQHPAATETLGGFIFGTAPRPCFHV